LSTILWGTKIFLIRSYSGCNTSTSVGPVRPDRGLSSLSTRTCAHPVRLR